MFGTRKNDPLLDSETMRCLDEMGEWPQDSEEYQTRLAHLERLKKLKADDRPDRVDRNTLAVVGGNILTILIIVAYEQKHVLQTRGLPFLLKPKI